MISVESFLNRESRTENNLNTEIMESNIAKVLLDKIDVKSQLSEVRVVYKSKSEVRAKITCSHDAYVIFKKLFDDDTIEYQEEFFLLLLNRTNEVLGWVKLSQGGTAGTVVDPRIIFTIALLTNSSSFVMAHNHPSGNIIPSKNDKELTKSISEFGRLVEIALLDHLIISYEDRYYSFADEGDI